MVPGLSLMLGGLWLAQTGMSAHAAELYRWKEAGGAVVYTDTLPPEKVREEHTILNPQGRAVRSLPAELTPEQRESLRQAEIRREQAEREARKQAERDELLLKLYASEDSIIEARDARLAALDAQRKILERQLDEQRAYLAMLKEREPDHADIPKLEQRLDEGTRALTRLKRERQHTLDAFADDLVRWRAIKVVSGSAPRSRLNP